MCFITLFFRSIPSVLERLLVIKDLLSLRNGLSEHDCGLNRLLANACLVRQDEAVATVEHSDTDILRIEACLCWILLEHRLHDLTLQVDGHGGHVGRLDHPLLCEHQFLRRELLAEFVSQHNYTVRVLEDALELMDSFKVVDLGDESDVLASITKRILHLLQVFDRSDVRNDEVVEAVLDSDGQNVILVLV